MSTWFCDWFLFGGDVWLATFVFKVESIWVLLKLSWSVRISVGCCQTTSGIGGSFDIAFVSGLSHAAPEWRRGIFSVKFGLQLGLSHLSCFVHCFAGLGFVLLVVDSGEVVYLQRLLQGSISLWSGWLTTCFAGWEDRSRSPVSLIVYIVCPGIVWNFGFGVRFCLGTIIVIVGTIRFISGLVFFSFELTALILIVIWFFYNGGTLVWVC